MELDRSQQAAQLAVNRAQLQTQIRNIATAEAALKSARITAQSNQVKLERTRNVVQRGADTQQALDDAQTQYQTSVEAVQQQQASLAAARSQVQEARSQISLNEVQLTKRYVRAPADGVLLTMDVREGAQLSPGTGIGEFAPKSPTTALCEVD